MIKLRSMRFGRSNSKLINGGRNKIDKQTDLNLGEIRWELRPGGMLVQKRVCVKGEGFITIKVSTVFSHCHDVSIGATSTFGELKMVLSQVTGLERSEQRLLYRGKEREDNEHLHMVGVSDKDKVLLLEDPAIKERKLRAFIKNDPLATTCRTIRV